MNILFHCGLIFLIFCTKTSLETISENVKCYVYKKSLFCEEIPKDLPDNVTHVYLKFDKIAFVDSRYRTGILHGDNWKNVKFLYTNEINRFALDKPLIALSNLEVLEVNEVPPFIILAGFFKGLSRLKSLKITYNTAFCQMESCSLPIFYFYNILELSHLKQLHLEGVDDVSPYALDTLKRLKKLSITGNENFDIISGTFAGIGRLKVLRVKGLRKVKSHALSSLKQLQKLTIKVTDNFSFDNQAFAELSNLKVLKWSGSGRTEILTETIESVIKGMPNLTEFALSYMTIWHASRLLNTLFSKPLTSLILKNIRASETFLLELLKYTTYKVNTFRAFHPLKRVNATLCGSYKKVTLPSHNAYISLNVATSTLQLYIPIFVSSRESIDITGIYAENRNIDLNNLTVTLWGNCADSVRQIIIRNVGLRVIDVTLICKKLKLERLDMSLNDIEFLKPKFCPCCSRLVEINLSNNNLFKMADRNNSLFGQVLSFYQNLKTIRLSLNRLTRIPEGMFRSNKRLELIDLSNNLLASVGFRIKHLRNLKSLNLQNNVFKTLDQQSFTNLQALPVLRGRQATLTHYGGIYKFGGNPFSCSKCDILPTLKWLATTRLVDRFGQSVTCMTFKNLIPLTQNAVKHLQWECDKPKRLRNTILLSTSVTLGVIGFSVVAIYICFRYRQMKRKQKDIAEKIELFRLNRLNEKYLVFLSYNSNDTDFVNEYVYTPLNLHLKQIIGIDRDTVCLGDSHFQLGKPINDEIVLCLQQSAVVLLLLSRNFCESEYCRMEFDHALRMNKPFILMVKDDVDVNEMVPSLQELFMRNTRLLWERKGDIYEIKTSWENVLESIFELCP